MAEAGAEANTTLVTRYQTAGRGRAGHTWQAPAGSSLLFSTLLCPQISLERVPWVTLCVGLGVCEGIAQETGLRVGLKWPNDVLVRNRKCAGILCEGLPPKGGESCARIVAGVGINLTTPRECLPERPIFPATSLALEGGCVGDARTLLECLLDRIQEWVHCLEQEDGPARIAARFEEMDALRGKRLRVTLPNGTEISGTEEGISEEGFLRLQTPDGPYEVLAGSVSLDDAMP